MQYTVAFIFSRSPSGQLKVLLIRKNRPEWQTGKLNGIGGKVEESDPCPTYGCDREILEETGLRLPWIQHVATMNGKSCEIWFFAYEISWELFISARALTDEVLKVCDVDDLPPDVIPNLRWLIPLALNVLRHDHDGGFLVST